MATKKVKGQKLDLASFNGIDADSSMELPSAPNPNREPNEGRGRGRRDFSNSGYDGGGNRNDQRSFKGNDNFDGNWSRSDSTNVRGGNQMPSRNFDPRQSDNNDGRTNDPWQRSSQQSNQTVLRFDNTNRTDPYGNSNSRERDYPSQRPDHMKLKLEPRSSNSSYPVSSTSNNSSSVDSDDKWSKVFSKSKQTNVPQSTTRPQEPTRTQDVRNTFNDLKIDSDIGLSGNKNSTTQSDKVSTTDTKASNKENKVKQTEQAKSVNLDAEKKRLEKEEALKKSQILAEEQSLLEEKMLKYSEELLNTELKGEPIKEYAQKMETKPTAASLLKLLLPKLTDASITWLNDSEYGLVLKYLMGKIDDKVNSLFIIQDYCNRLKFPKIDVKGSQRSLIEVIFQLLFKKEIIDDLSFLQWADDERDSNGRMTAIVHTTNFMQLLTDEEDDEDFEEEEDVDRPREIVT